MVGMITFYEDRDFNIPIDFGGAATDVRSKTTGRDKNGTGVGTGLIILEGFGWEIKVGIRFLIQEILLLEQEAMMGVWCGLIWTKMVTFQNRVLMEVS